MIDPSKAGAIEWTKLDLGVEHIIGLPRGYHTTVLTHPNYAVVIMLSPSLPMRRLIYNSRQEAKEGAERAARLLLGYE